MCRSRPGRAARRVDERPSAGGLARTQIERPCANDRDDVPVVGDGSSSQLGDPGARADERVGQSTGNVQDGRHLRWVGLVQGPAGHLRRLGSDLHAAPACLLKQLGRDR